MYYKNGVDTGGYCGGHITRKSEANHGKSKT